MKTLNYIKLKMFNLSTHHKKALGKFGYLKTMIKTGGYDIMGPAFRNTKTKGD